MEAVFTRGEPLPVPRQQVAAERPTVMAFADDAPLFNWGHPCRYLLHDAESGALYRQVHAQFPPFSRERDMPAAFRFFHEAVQHPEALPQAVAQVEAGLLAAVIQQDIEAARDRDQELVAGLESMSGAARSRRHCDPAVTGAAQFVQACRDGGPLARDQFVRHYDCEGHGVRHGRRR